MHQHHPIAKSRGGTDDYTELLDPYTHCYGHALDFVLFEKAPRFDFRHEAWPLLPRDLQNAVIKEAKRRGKENNYLTEDGRLRGGLTRGKQCAEQNLGVCGRTSEQMTADGKKGGKLGGIVQGRRNAQNKTGFCDPEVQSKNAKTLNSKRVQCTVTGHISTPGGLSRYQQSRNIDHTNPNNRKPLQ